jgi:hypothetical protein
VINFSPISARRKQRDNSRYLRKSQGNPLRYCRAEDFLECDYTIPGRNRSEFSVCVPETLSGAQALRIEDILRVDCLQINEIIQKLRK